MFMLDRWEELESSGNYDLETLQVAKDLAFTMCSTIFERMGLSIMTDEASLRVAGRGATFVFPLRGNNIPMKYAGREGTPRAGTVHAGSERSPRRNRILRRQTS